VTTWHLAQFNVGQLRAPIEHPDSAGFADNLDPIDTRAEDRLTALQTNEPNHEAFTFMLTFSLPAQSH
jgi:hypothetical protein